MTSEPGAAALLARIDERTEHTLHRVRNIEQRLDAYVTSRDLSAQTTRIDTLEKNVHKGMWAIIMAWIAGLAAVGNGLLK